MARVMGPIPPGIGETNEALSKTPGQTSPSKPSDVREIPTSITTAPDLIMSAFRKCDCPIATTTMSAL